MAHTPESELRDEQREQRQERHEIRTETYVSEGQSSKLNPSLLCRTITPMCFSDEGGKVFLDNDDGNEHEDLFFGEFDSDSQSWKLFESKLNGEEKGLLPMQHEYLIILYYCPKMLFFYFLLYFVINDDLRRTAF